MWRAGPSAPRKKGICEAEKTRSTCKRLASSISGWHVSKLQLNAAGIHAKVPFAVVSCLRLGSQRAIEVARCERRHVLETIDSQWTRSFNSLETNRFEHVDIIMTNQYIMLIVTFFGYFWYGDSLHDLLKASGFDACAKNIQKHTSCIHVVSQTRCQAVSRTGLETWSPASAWEVLAPIQQPIVTTSAKGRQGRSRLPFSFSGPLMSSVNSTCSTWFNPLISKLHQKRNSGPGWGQGQTRSKRVLLGGFKEPLPWPRGNQQLLMRTA